MALQEYLQGYQVKLISNKNDGSTTALWQFADRLQSVPGAQKAFTVTRQLSAELILSAVQGPDSSLLLQVALSTTDYAISDRVATGRLCTPACAGYGPQIVSPWRPEGFHHQAAVCCVSTFSCAGGVLIKAGCCRWRCL